MASCMRIKREEKREQALAANDHGISIVLLYNKNHLNDKNYGKPNCSLLVFYISFCSLFKLSVSVALFISTLCLYNVALSTLAGPV